MFSFFRIKRVQFFYFFLSLLFAVSALVYVYLFSYSTSPLYPYYYGGDSAQFLTMGKAWFLGKIPYRDMFDHKGPFIFFIDMLGYALTGGKSTSGVAFLQMLFMFSDLLIIYITARMYEIKRIPSIFISLTSLLAIKYNYIDGNTVEEWCLPFLLYSFYLILKYFKQEKSCNPSNGLVFGLTAAVCLFTRVTNLLPVIFGIIGIFINLLVQKRNKNIWKNILSFLVGFGILAVPFGIYFAANGCFYEFLNGTIFFNIKYAEKLDAWHISTDANGVRAFLKTYFLHYCIFLSVIFVWIKKNYSLMLILLCTGLSEVYIFWNGTGYGQYPLVCLPQFVLLLCEIYTSNTEPEKESKIFQQISFYLAFWFLGVCFYESAAGAKDYGNMYMHQSDRGWEGLMAEIPEEDKESFVAYGDNSFKEIYLLTDTMPCYKYFAIQEWHAMMSAEIKSDIHKTFADGNAKYILTVSSTDNINDVLAERYHLVDSQNNMSLYQLNGCEEQPPSLHSSK